MMIVFQVIYGEAPSIIIPCLESVDKYYPHVKRFIFPAVERPVIESDKFRIGYISQHDDVLFIDWDVLLSAPLVLSNRISTNFLNKAPDYSIIYSPEKEYWVEIERERIERGISKDTYAWPRKLLRGKRIAEIKDNFTHFRHTGGKV